jgi:hypothetical protein
MEMVMSLNKKEKAARGEEEGILTAAACGASLAEIAACYEVTEEWLLRNFGRQIAKAWARRNIHIRSALTKLALHGNMAAIKRVTELERRASDEHARKYRE